MNRSTLAASLGVMMCAASASAQETPVESGGVEIQSDSWSPVYSCVFRGASSYDFRYPLPQVQVHYREWQRGPFASTLRAIDGFAFSVSDPNWPVREVVIDTIGGGRLLPITSA